MNSTFNSRSIGILSVGIIAMLGMFGLALLKDRRPVSAATAYQSLADSTASENSVRHVQLKDYALYRSQIDWPLRSDGCPPSATTSFKSIPWQPATSYGGTDARGFFDGNTFNAVGNCSWQYTDAGSSSGAWAKPNSFDLWASDSVPQSPSSSWTSPGYSNSAKLDGCSALPLGTPGRLWATGGYTNQDQAYGADGLFARNRISGASGELLYSHGTIFVRNKFNLTSDQITLINSATSDLFIYAIADDWFQVYINGVKAGATNTTSSTTTIALNSFKGILHEGENTIAFQVTDKAIWANPNTRGAGFCYQFAVRYDDSVPSIGTEFKPLVEASSPVVTLGEDFSFYFKVQNVSVNSGATDYDLRVVDSSGNVIHSSTGNTPTIRATPYSLPTYTGTALPSHGGAVCATLTVQGGAKTAGPVCIAIGKKPLFQVWNGDVWAGGAFNDGSGVCNVDASSPGSVIGAPNVGAGGSWGEYGVFALGEIKDFGSAAQPRHSGQPATKLSFSNTNPAGPGYYHGNPLTHGRCLTDALNHFGSSYDATIGSAGTVTNVNISGSGPGQGHRILVAGDSLVKMGGGSSKITQEKTIVVRTEGTMTIATDIRYQTTGITGIDKIPQVLLMADNIIIKGNVGRIDAWLVAKNTIYTCDMLTGSLTTGDCNPGTPLVINSPVITNEIKLRRTHGADAGRRNVPAEKFNLRPDVYLRAYADKKVKPQVRTVREQELPPRY